MAYFHYFKFNPGIAELLSSSAWLFPRGGPAWTLGERRELFYFDVAEALEMRFPDVFAPNGSALGPGALPLMVVSRFLIARSSTDEYAVRRRLVQVAVARQRWV
jgi:hypothetical protein